MAGSPADGVTGWVEVCISSASQDAAAASGRLRLAWCQVCHTSQRGAVANAVTQSEVAIARWAAWVYGLMAESIAKSILVYVSKDGSPGNKGKPV